MDAMSKKDVMEILKQDYGIEPKTVEKSAWGYSSIAYYVEDQSANKYAFKTSLPSSEKFEKLNKDIVLSGLLKKYIPTPEYIKNNSGQYVFEKSGAIIRVAKYIEGTAPFDMNMDIYAQILEVLKKIHKVPVMEIDIPLQESYTNLGPARLLHGDLTASNVIVADNVIIGVMDFEDSFFGPMEYDMARSAVFCWYRMKNISFQEVFDFTSEKFPSADKKLVLDFAIQHSQGHLNQVIQNKSKYTDMVFWNDDYLFSNHAFEEISKTKI